MILFAFIYLFCLLANDQSRPMVRLHDLEIATCQQWLAVKKNAVSGTDSGLDNDKVESELNPWKENTERKHGILASPNNMVTNGASCFHKHLIVCLVLLAACSPGVPTLSPLHHAGHDTYCCFRWHLGSKPLPGMSGAMFSLFLRCIFFLDTYVYMRICITWDLMIY